MPMTFLCTGPLALGLPTDKLRIGDIVFAEAALYAVIHADREHNVPAGTRALPLEHWFEWPAMWIRDDGSRVSRPLGGDPLYPGRIGRWRIRRAIRNWDAAHPQ